MSTDNTDTQLPPEIDNFIAGRFNMVFDPKIKGKLGLIPGMIKDKPVVHLVMVAPDPNGGEDLIFPIARMYSLDDLKQVQDYMGNKPGSEGDKNATH